MDSGAKIDSINLDFTPEFGTLTPGAEKLIVRHFYDSCFSVVDLTDRTVDTTCVTEGVPMQALVSDARPDTAWLLFGGVSSAVTGVVQTDLETLAQEDTIFLAQTQPIAEGAVTPDGLIAVIPLPSVPESNGKVGIVGLTGNIGEATVNELTVNRFPLHAVVTADGARAYVANGAPDDELRSTISVIDIPTATGGVRR